MQRRNIEFLDFAKGFAILSIVIFHYLQPYTAGIWSKAIMVGGTGVHLFFILSGFGLGLSSTKLNPTAFYRKRFIKILLPYYAAVSFICIINGVYHFYGENSLYAIGGHFLLYKMFDENIIGSYGYFFWFISTIVQFYVVFPLIIRIKNSISLSQFILFSFSVSFLYWIVISLLGLAHLRVYNSFFFQYLWEFNLGIVFAEQYLKNGKCFWNKSVFVLAPIAIAGLTIMALMVTKGGRLGQTFNDIPAAVGYACLTATIYLLLSKLNSIRSLITYTGKISYELYLLHMISFLLLNNFIFHLTGINENMFAAIFFILPISVLVAKYFAAVIRLINSSTQASKKT